MCLIGFVKLIISLKLILDIFLYVWIYVGKKLRINFKFRINFEYNFYMCGIMLEKNYELIEFIIDFGYIFICLDLC